jgi:transposase InsO family protein
MRFAFIGAEKARHPVPMLCRMLRVSRSGYYAWRRRAPSRRALDDARLGTLIVRSHREGRGTYGSPRVLDDLREWGERVSRKRVARLMKERNLVGEMKKRWRHPSSAPSDAVVAPNTLDRAFNVPQPNRVWASDITYVRTYEGWLYLAVVIDLFSRRVVGWSIQSSLHTDIVLSALTMAVGQRLPGPGLLQHSDRGSQYTSDDYQRALRSHGIECSFSGRGNCWDNACVESFFGTLKRELIHRRGWPTRREAAEAIHEYIEVFYNRRRRHTTLGGKPPAVFEALAQRQTAQAA